MRLRKKSRSISRNSFWLFLLPSLSGVSVFVLIPFADVVRRSFMTSLSGKWCGLKNYAEVFRNPAFLLAVQNTARFVGVCLPLLFACSLLLAVAIDAITALEPVKVCVLLPMAMPAATVALVWRLTFAKQGFLSGLLGKPCDFLGGSASFFVLTVTYLWKNLGFTTVLWIAALKTVPGEIKEAARVDGAGEARTFFLITLPYLKGAAGAIGLLSFLNAFKVFREVYLIAGAYPDEDIYLLQHVFHNWYAKLDFDKMAAGAVLAALVLSVFAFWLAGRMDGE